MSEIPFIQRFGLAQSKPIDDDFPKSARIALAYLLWDLVEREYVESWRGVHKELGRVGRLSGLGWDSSESDFDMDVRLLQDMTWIQIYTFCERVHDQLLIPAGYLPDDAPDDAWVETANISEVRKYFAGELNSILAEENLDYHFVNGRFQRRGRPQTQENIQRIGKVLVDSRLSSVRVYFNRARKFFDERPDPDAENCVKESICALEAAVEVLTGKPVSGDFAKTVKQLQGNQSGQIPPPIAEGMIKLHAYRGAGKGVAHAALQGSSVSEIEAELVMSLVATYITYLYDLFPQVEDALPF
jgi:hypothetical protein